jgi:hypothetical protein
VKRPSFRWTWLALFASAIAYAVAGVHGSPSVTTSAASLSLRTTSAQPTVGRDFRLGSASRPLGWSTVVGDFNRDGTPDFAIADRVEHYGGGYQFRLEFSVSGLQTQTVALDSTQEALTLGASDVDNDNDLDVVVTGTLSHAIVGVWLNDGHGSFGRSNVTAVPPSIAATSEVTGDRVPTGAASVVLSDRFAGLNASRARVPAIQDISTAASRELSATPFTHLSSSESRAPPEDSLHSIV